MKFAVPALLLITAVVSTGCCKRSSDQSVAKQTQHTAAGVETADDSAKPSPEQALGPYLAAGAWSAPVNGLSARLLVSYQILKSDKYPTYFHYQNVILEAKNVGPELLAFSNQPSFTDLAIRDAQGEELRGRGYEGNHITGPIRWAVIPEGAYLGLRVDTAIPVHVGLYFQSFATEDHSLHATLIATKQDGPENQWLGEIKLPPINLVLTEHEP